MEIFQRIVDGLLSNQISKTFCLIIVAYFVFSTIYLIFERGGSQRLKALVDNAPTTLTSLGILGTFTGIFVGLLDFDVRTINRSVPLLLEGLKVAFGTSILGLFSAVLFRILRPLLSRVSFSEVASTRDILESLRSLNTAVETSDKSNREALQKLLAGLIDDKDNSVYAELQRMRANITYLQESTVRGFETQQKEFREFSEHLSKAFSEALITELKLVIQEFNEKISEQFGENFKQLNQAVGLLVRWQENYKQQLEELKNEFDRSLKGIQKSENALSAIEASARAIPDHMDKLSEISLSLQRQLIELHEGLSSLAEMRSKAESAVPEMTASIESMTQTINEAVKIQRDSAQEVSNIVVSATSEIYDTVKWTSKSIEETLREQQESQELMLTGMQTVLNSSLQNITDQLNEAIVQLDKELQKEIEGVLRVMAENLSGITQKFVQDYTPLLNETRKIAELSRQPYRL